MFDCVICHIVVHHAIDDCAGAIRRDQRILRLLMADIVTNPMALMVGMHRIVILIQTGAIFDLLCVAGNPNRIELGHRMKCCVEVGQWLHLIHVEHGQVGWHWSWCSRYYRLSSRSTGAGIRGVWL